MNRRRFILRSLGATLALPGLTSLKASVVGGNGAVQMAKGAGMGARRFVAIGNLLGFQVKQLFPTTSGREYEKTTLLEPLWDNRNQMTVYRGLIEGELYDLQEDPEERHNRWADPDYANVRLQVYAEWIQAELEREPTRFARISHA